MKSEHIAFIDAYIENQSHIDAYQKAYPHSSRTTAATRGKLLLKRPDVAEKIEELLKRKEEIIKKEREKNLELLVRDRTLSELEVDKILSEIILGTHETEKVVFNPRNGTATKIKVKPSQKEKTTAIDIYYRRYGKYPPSKISLGGDKDAPPITAAIVGKISHSVNFQNAQGD
jgi:phage terminase small subunit